MYERGYKLNNTCITFFPLIFQPQIAKIQPLKINNSHRNSTESVLSLCSLTPSPQSAPESLILKTKTGRIIHREFPALPVGLASIRMRGAVYFSEPNIPACLDFVDDATGHSLEGLNDLNGHRKEQSTCIDTAINVRNIYRCSYISSDDNTDTDDDVTLLKQYRDKNIKADEDTQTTTEFTEREMNDGYEASECHGPLTSITDDFTNCIDDTGEKRVRISSDTIEADVYICKGEESDSGIYLNDTNNFNDIVNQTYPKRCENNDSDDENADDRNEEYTSSELEEGNIHSKAAGVVDVNCECKSSEIHNAITADRHDSVEHLENSSIDVGAQLEPDSKETLIIETMDDLVKNIISRQDVNEPERLMTKRSETLKVHSIPDKENYSETIVHSEHNTKRKDSTREAVRKPSTHMPSASTRTISSDYCFISRSELDSEDSYMYDSETDSEDKHVDSDSDSDKDSEVFVILTTVAKRIKRRFKALFGDDDD